MSHFNFRTYHFQPDNSQSYLDNSNRIYPVQKQPGIERRPDKIVSILKLRFRRLWTALKFQFHQLTLGLFRKEMVRKVVMLGIAGFWLFQAEPGFLKSLGNPVYGFFQSDESPVYNDYPIASYKPVEGGSKNANPKQASNPSSIWDAFTGDDGGNSYAPVSANNLREKQALEYIEKYQLIARAEMEKFEIPASIALAQGLVESRAGTSRLARGNNNHFGMKCFSKKCPTGHCTNATDDHHKDFFRKYGSAWESWRAHSLLLNSGHYSKLKKFGRNYRQWAHGLKSLGYATDRTYAEKLIGMIEKYGLHRFDR